MGEKLQVKAQHPLLSPHHPALGLCCEVLWRAAACLWEGPSTANRIFRSYLVSGSRVQVFSHASHPLGEGPCKYLQSYFICLLSSLPSHPSLGTRVAGLEVSLATHPAGNNNLSSWDWHSPSFSWACLLFCLWSSWHNGVLAPQF